MIPLAAGDFSVGRAGGERALPSTFGIRKLHSSELNSPMCLDQH